MFVAVLLCGFHDLVEGDRFGDRARPVERMRHLVDETGFEHQEEAFGILFEHLDRGVEAFGEVGLLGELLHGVALPLMAVDPAVHVARVEEPEKLRGVARLGERFAIGDELVARFWKRSM